jgi:hypothetical protein
MSLGFLAVCAPLLEHRQLARRSRSCLQTAGTSTTVCEGEMSRYYGALWRIYISWNGVSIMEPVLGPPDDTPLEFIGRRLILERAATRADIATFELLRAKGAPPRYDCGVLPLAVMAANDHAPKTGDSPSTKFQQRMDMVRHLLDVVGCDVNSKSNGLYRYGDFLGSRCSTPLCWIACRSVGDAKDLIWLLLDRGGDLDLARPNEGNWSAPSAREAASRRPNTRFLKAVEEWQAKREGHTE